MSRVSVASGWRRLVAGAVLTVSAACGGHRDVTQPPLQVTADVALAAADFTLLSGTQVSGRVRFPAAGAQGAQYLVVGQFATGTPDVTANFAFGGATDSGAAAAAADRVFRPLDPGARFHAALRSWDADLVRQARASGARVAAAPPVPAPPPQVGDKRTFKVCATLDATGCATFKNVPATASYVGAHAAIFVDDSAPAGGLSAGDIAQIGAQFDNDLYPIDVNAFGSESDVDANGVVIVLLTKTVNNLVLKPDCTTSFIVGFFLGADIFPTTRAQYNNGEVFYGLVPEPTPPATRCAYSVNTVKRLLPSTFIHEFQHMISFNQHALVRSGDTEVLWLNEAMSHTAEELAGLHYDSLGQTTTANNFLIGNLYDAFLYLRSPNAHTMVTESSTGTLEERGGEWLFLRYLTDRFGSGILKQLDATASTGAANVVAVTGTPFATLLGRWALAVYVTDLSGFTPPAPLTYDTWRFRTTFANLNASDAIDFPLPYPLLPLAQTNAAFTQTGPMNSGSGTYVLITQAASAAGFALTFRTAAGGAFAATAGAQLAIVRIR